MIINYNNNQKFDKKSPNYLFLPPSKPKKSSFLYRKIRKAPIHILTRAIKTRNEQEFNDEIKSINTSRIFEEQIKNRNKEHIETFQKAPTIFYTNINITEDLMQNERNNKFIKGKYGNMNEFSSTISNNLCKRINNNRLMNQSTCQNASSRENKAIPFIPKRAKTRCETCRNTEQTLPQDELNSNLDAKHDNTKNSIIDWGKTLLFKKYKNEKIFIDTGSANIYNEIETVQLNLSYNNSKNVMPNIQHNPEDIFKIKTKIINTIIYLQTEMNIHEVLKENKKKQLKQKISPNCIKGLLNKCSRLFKLRKDLLNIFQLISKREV